jgi:phenylacetate-CoA ligase
VVEKYTLNRDAPGSEAIWSPGLETISRDRLLAIQDEKLAAAFAYLYEASPFYRQKFSRAGLQPGDIRSRGDLARIPVTTKEEWIADQTANPPWGTFSPLTRDEWARAGWTMFTTSGATAALPRSFRYSRGDLETSSWLSARALWSMGVRPGDVGINCFGYGTSAAFWSLHYGMNRIGCPVISGGGTNTRRRAMFIHTYQPTVLICTPSYALRLARTMQELEYDPRASSIRLIVAAAEPGPGIPATKKRIEDLWGARLHDDFGCTAAAITPLGYTCEPEVAQSERPVRVHLMEDSYIAEVVDPRTFEPVDEGTEGVLVVSNLNSESHPVLRYVMGDWTTLTTQACACGRTHAQAIGGLHGRSDSMVRIRGVAFLPSALEDGIRKHPDLGDEFIVEIVTVDDMDRVRITVEPASAIPKESYTEPRERLRRELKGVLGIDVEVKLVPFGTLPRDESPHRDRVVDLRDRSPAFTASGVPDAAPTSP